MSPDKLATKWMSRSSGNLLSGYVIARSFAGRPTLQHRVGRTPNETACGIDISQWSRRYMTERLDEILCRRAKCQ